MIRRFGLALLCISVLLLLPPWHSSVHAALDDNLLACYRYDAGGLTTDSHGMHTLTNNGPATETTGQINGAADLAGAGFYFSIADHADWNFGTAFTVGGWVRVDNLDDAHGVIAQSSYGVDGGWAIQITADGAVQVFVQTGASDTGNWTSTSSGIITATTWAQVFFVYNGSLVGNQARAKIYVDNVNETAGDSGTIPATLLNPTVDLTLGRWAGLRNFDGRLDNWAIWSRALTATEVTTDLWNAGAGTECPFGEEPESGLNVGLLACYRFDNAALTTDSQGAHTLTNNGTATDTTGQINGAADVDGAGVYFSVADHSDWNFSTDFTVGGWLRLDNLSDAYGVIAQSSFGSDGGWVAQIGTSGEVQFYIQTGASDTANWTATGLSAIAATTWYQVFFVYDGSLSGNQNRAKIYVDAMNATAADAGTVPATLLDATTDLTLGRWTGLRNYDGRLDNWAIWNRPLTSTEITTDIWNSGTGQQCPFMGGAPPAPPSICLLSLLGVGSC